MSQITYAPVCGLYCGECEFLGKQCAGCGNVAGKPFWTSQIPNGICPLYDCCKNKKQLGHCGLCEEFPCKIFNELRDPNLSDDEFEKSLAMRKSDLLRRKEIGIEKWLQEKNN